MPLKLKNIFDDKTILVNMLTIQYRCKISRFIVDLYFFGTSKS